MSEVNILQRIVTGINNQGRDEFIYNSHPISSHYPPALLLKCQMKHFKEQHCSTLHLKQLSIPVRDISLELINACAHCSALPPMQNQRHKFCKAIQRSSYTKLWNPVCFLHLTRESFELCQNFLSGLWQRKLRWRSSWIRQSWLHPKSQQLWLAGAVCCELQRE